MFDDCVRRGSFATMRNAGQQQQKSPLCVGISGLHVREKLERQADQCGFSTLRFSCFGLPRVRKLRSNRRKPPC
jgi:hypothetical protein